MSFAWQVLTESHGICCLLGVRVPQQTEVANQSNFDAYILLQ